MTHDGTRRRNKNYGDSPVRRSAVPIASSVLESCSPIADARSWKTACISNTRHSLEAPLRVDSGVLASPAKCVPATQPSLCRALLMQPAIARASGSLNRRQDFVAARVGIARAASRKDSVSQSSAYPGRNSFSTSPNAARTLSWERTANPPSHTRWISR
jgi:hypothetical protein